MLGRIAFAVLLFPAAASAQRPDTTMVPRELAVALASVWDVGGRELQIIVGRIPDERLAALIPATARVLGGLSYQSRRGQTTTIMSMRERPDSALTLVASKLESTGFKPAPTFESMEAQRGGFAFRTTSFGMGMGNSLNYCGDSSSVTAYVGEGADRGSTVRLVATGSLRNSMCDRARQYMRGPGLPDEVEMPTLRPPVGATGGGGGSGGSSDSREANARLRSTLTAAEMIDHFVPQLKEQGWTVADRATAGDVSVQTARKTDKNGEGLFLILMDSRFVSREHDLSMRVSRQRRDN